MMRSLLLICLLVVAASAQPEFFDVSAAAIGCDCAFELVPRDTTVCCGEEPFGPNATASAGGVELEVTVFDNPPADGVIVRTFTATCPASDTQFLQTFEDVVASDLESFIINIPFDSQGFELTDDTTTCQFDGDHSESQFVHWGVFGDCAFYSQNNGHADLFSLPPVATDSCTALTVSFNYTLQIDPSFAVVYALITISGPDPNTQSAAFQIESSLDTPVTNPEEALVIDPSEPEWKPFVFERTSTDLGFDIAAVHIDFFAAASPGPDLCAPICFDEFLPCDDHDDFASASIRVEQTPGVPTSLDFIIDASDSINEIFFELAPLADEAAALLSNLDDLDCTIAGFDENDLFIIEFAPAIPVIFNSDECASGNTDSNDAGFGPSNSFDMQVFILPHAVEPPSVFTLTCDFGTVVCPVQVQGTAIYHFSFLDVTLARAAMPTLSRDTVSTVLPGLLDISSLTFFSSGATDPHVCEPELACAADLPGAGFLVDDISISCTGEEFEITADQVFDIIPGVPIEDITFDCPNCADDLFDDLSAVTNVNCPSNPAVFATPTLPIGPVCEVEQTFEVNITAAEECGGDLVLVQRVTVLPDILGPNFVDIDSICLKASGLWARFDVGLEFFAVEDNCDAAEDISIEVVSCEVVDSAGASVSAADAASGGDGGVEAAGHHSGGSGDPCKIVTNPDGSTTIFLQGVKPKQGTRAFDITFLLTDLCGNPTTVTRTFFVDSNPKSIECFAGSWQQNADGTFSLADGSGESTPVATPIPSGGGGGGRRDNNNTPTTTSPTTNRRNTDSSSSSGKKSKTKATKATKRGGTGGAAAGGKAKTKNATKATKNANKAATKAGKTKAKAAKTKNAGAAAKGKTKANKSGKSKGSR